MANQIHFDASAARAYVKYPFAGAHATVYLEVGYMVPASSLTAMIAAADAASGFGPAFCGVASDIASNPFGGFPNFAQDIFPVDSDINGTFDQFGDEYASTVNVTHTLVADTPFVLKTLVKHTGTGAYFAVDANTAGDLTTGLDMDGIWVGINTGGGTHTGYESWVSYIKAGTTDGGSDLLDFDASTASDLSAFTVSGAVALEDPDAVGGGGPTGDGAGGVRVSMAFDDPTLEPNPTWTDLTSLSSSMVASFEIDRGRGNEFDPTDAATASVTINDRYGLLDPTNSTGPFFEKIEPDLQIILEVWDPCAGEWSTRFRGWVEDYDYEEHESQQVAFLTISVYDIFALMGRIEMQPGQFGDTPPAGSEGTVFFDNATFQDRITQVFTNAIGTPATDQWLVAFSGNVNLLEHTLSAGSNPMEVAQAAADAEFPGVANVYPDRFGRCAAHGRLAVFDPHGTWVSIAGTDAARDAVWAYREWKAGDATAVAGSPSDTAQIRPPYKFNRGIDSIVNSASATPQGIDDGDVAGQLVTDSVSIGLRGIKSWSKNNLLVDNGILTGNTGNDECKLYATFYVTNYEEPRNRVDELTFRSMDPSAAGAAANWLLLTHVDIADRLDLTVTHPGTGGFNLEPFYVQGVKETAEPANREYANLTVTVQLTPKALFDNPVGLDGN